MKWWRKKRTEEDLERELRSDLELEAQERRESGLAQIPRPRGRAAVPGRRPVRQRSHNRPARDRRHQPAGRAQEIRVRHLHHSSAIGRVSPRSKGISPSRKTARWRRQRPGYGSSICRPDQPALFCERWTFFTIERTTTTTTSGRSCRSILLRRSSLLRQVPNRALLFMRSTGSPQRSTR